MNNVADDFLHAFRWHRNLSKQLLVDIPFEYFGEQLSPRSLTLSTQFIDLGDMQLKAIDLLLGKNKKSITLVRPVDNKATKEEILAYIETCNTYFEEEVRKVPEDARMDWFGRMNFDLKESLAFFLAHEAMHHGEILSFIFAKNIPMPPSFKKTWGFERNLS